jgi:predicted histone-like DNA-binding protein
MKRGSTTKKAGTISYQLYERNDLTGKATKKNPAMGVTIVDSTIVTTSELADSINHASSITQADVVAVLQAIGQHLTDALLDGNRVELDHIGTFSLALTCGNKHKDDHITNKDISVSRIVFSPCSELLRQMNNATIVSGGPTGTKHLSDDDIEKRLTAYFATNHSISRSRFEQICECSRHTALTKLKELVKAGKLIAIGPKNLRQYMMHREQ